MALAIVGGCDGLLTGVLLLAGRRCRQKLARGIGLLPDALLDRKAGE